MEKTAGLGVAVPSASEVSGRAGGCFVVGEGVSESGPSVALESVLEESECLL